MPWTYRHASREWAHVLAQVKAETGLVTDHTAYTALDGVLRAFRARLTVAEAIGFAQVLPCVMRAIFVQDWDVTAVPAPSGTRADWTAEAQTLRQNHNIAPDTCVEAVAIALRRTIRREDLDRALESLPAFATEFWSCPTADPASLHPGII